MNDVKINGNIATVEIYSLINLHGFVSDFGLDAFSVMTSDGSCEISFPMDAAHHRLFAAHIHRHNNEKKREKKGNGKPDPDGNGPKPTNPRGGGGSTVDFENTVAIAA